MREIIVAVLLVIGAFFALVAALGLIRMPDLYMRLSTTTKASTLGVSSLLLAAAAYFDSGKITAQVIAIIVFIILTAPVAAHMIGRAAYFNKVPLWKESLYDDLKSEPEKEAKQEGPPGEGRR